MNPSHNELGKCASVTPFCLMSVIIDNAISNVKTELWKADHIFSIAQNRSVTKIFIGNTTA